MFLSPHLQIFKKDWADEASNETINEVKKALEAAWWGVWQWDATSVIRRMGEAPSCWLGTGGEIRGRWPRGNQCSGLDILEMISHCSQQKCFIEELVELVERNFKLVAVHKNSPLGVVQTFHDLLFVSLWDRCKVEQDWMYMCMCVYDVYIFFFLLNKCIRCINIYISIYVHIYHNSITHRGTKEIEMLAKKGPFPWRLMFKWYGLQTKRNLCI